MRGDRDAIRAPTEDRGGTVASNAPPQRDAGTLKYSHDLGGVVDPHDGDLIRGGGWGSWSASERLAILIAVALVAGIAAVVVVTLIL